MKSSGLRKARLHYCHLRLDSKYELYLEYKKFPKNTNMFYEHKQQYQRYQQYNTSIYYYILLYINRSTLKCLWLLHK